MQYHECQSTDNIRDVIDVTLVNITDVFKTKFSSDATFHTWFKNELFWECASKYILKPSRFHIVTSVTLTNVRFF